MRRTCETCEGYHECQCVLERIATALERLVAVFLHPPVVGSGTLNGYQCTRCWKWVPSGTFHSCNNFASALGAGDATSPGPTISFSPERCGYVTVANMQCLLEPNHSGAHKIL